MKITRVLSSALVILMISCSDPITRTSVEAPQPRENKPIDSVTVNAGLEETWNRVLSTAMNSSFKIKNIDSASHILSMIASGTPKLYINCGNRKIETEGNVVEVINADSQYTYQIYRRNHLDTYAIENHFNGKAILFVTGSPTTSMIQVKTDLELKSDQRMSTTQGPRHGSFEKYKLNLTGNHRVLFDGFGVTCQSTGKFEKEVLSLLRSI